MANETNVPDIDVTAQGLTIPDVDSVLTGVLQDFRDAFGGNLNITNVGTPQGLLAADVTYNIAFKNAELAYLMNMLDPSSAQGRWLDALAQIYFIERRPATRTIVQGRCVGVPNYTLPAGSKAKDVNGYIYESIDDAVFNSAGALRVNFQCMTPGSIPCPAGTLTSIAEVVDGWDSVNNLSDGTIGLDVESDNAFRQRRYESVAKNASGSIVALRGAVAAISGVTDVYVAENTTNANITVGVTNYTLVPHSILVCVNGGNGQEIANTIWRYKNAGSSMNGDRTVVVTDTSYGSQPYPTYNIRFLRPTEVQTYFIVNIASNSSLPSNISDLVKAAVVRVFNGLEWNSVPARIGGTVYAASYYDAVFSVSDYVNIVSIYVGKDANPNTTSATFGVNQLPSLTESNITVNLV